MGGLEGCGWGVLLAGRVEAGVVGLVRVLLGRRVGGMLLGGKVGGGVVE